MTPAPLLDATGVAELLQVPKTWVLAEARADRIPHLRFGRYVRFDPDDLQEWWRTTRSRGPIPGGSRPKAADVELLPVGGKS